MPRQQVARGTEEVERTFTGYRGLVRGERGMGRHDELRGPRLEGAVAMRADSGRSAFLRGHRAYDKESGVRECGLTGKTYSLGDNPGEGGE